MSNRGNKDNRKYCDRESPDDRKYAELEKLAEQYKRWNYSVKETPRISRESVEKFAPTDLTNLKKAKNAEPEQKATKEDVMIERTVKKESKQTKKFFDKLSTLGCMLPFILGGLVPVVVMFVGLWKFSDGNVGIFILNTITIPFAILGLVNMTRGFFKVIEDDEINLGINKYWQYALYFVANIIGYLAIASAIVQFVNQ